MPDLRALSIKQLRAFAAVARTGSPTAAAQELSVTPPAVSTHLRTLEQLVDAPILLRSGDALRPTQIGERLLEIAAEFEVSVERAAQKIDALKSGAEGAAVLGVVSTAKYFAPHIVAAFQSAHPGLCVALQVGNRGAMIQGLERGAYDLMIMGRPPAEPRTVEAVLGDNPHILIARPDHPLTAVEEAPREALRGEIFLAREDGSGTRILMSGFLDRIGLRGGARVIEMESNETIKQAAMAGLGIAMLSAHTCVAELKEGRLAPIRAQGLPLVRQWRLLHRQDRELDGAARALRRFIIDNAAALLPQVEV
ncbi:MAG: LysR family transcriptional regulator [Pseudomonadota bacterium]